MCKNEETKALSKVELILPANVVEACWNLKKNNQAFFFAVNDHDKTSSEINIHKLGDNSVKIRVTVFPLTDQNDDETADEEQAGTSSQQDESMEAEPEPALPIVKPPARGPGRPPKQIKVEGKGKSPRKQVEEATPKRGAIADTVKKMKSVLSPPKQKEDAANVQVIRQDEEDDQDYVVDEEQEPRASTIIIVKGPGSDEEEEATPGPSTSKTPKKGRVHTTTTASGKQIVYKTRTKRKEDQEIAVKKNAEAQKTPKSKEQKFMNKLALKESKNKEDEAEVEAEVRSPPAKRANLGPKIKQENEGKGTGKMSKVWKSIGVGEEQESGDVVITAESLKNATEGFQMSVNDTEYNFDVQETQPVMRTSTKNFSVSGDAGQSGGKKRRHSMPYIPSQKVWCMICGKTLLNYSYLYRHVRQFHKDIQDVDQYLDEIKPLMKTPCPICGKEISSMSNMSSHIQQCHPETPEPFQCEICMGYYKTRISLKHHMQSQHTENRRVWPCKYCGATFTETRSLKEHINCTHETTEVFTCEVCHKTFLTRGRLRRHMYIHGEYRLFCKYCGKGFHLKDNMNKHIDLIHEKKNQYRFKCEYCSKAFNVKGNLMQHINGVHLKTLPYRCPICDMGWRKKSAMLQHMAEHAVKTGDEGGAAATAKHEEEEEEYEEEEEEESMDDTLDESAVADEGEAVNQTI